MKISRVAAGGKGQRYDFEKRGSRESRAVPAPNANAELISSMQVTFYVTCNGPLTSKELIFTVKWMVSTRNFSYADNVQKIQTFFHLRINWCPNRKITHNWWRSEYRITDSKL